MTTSKQPHSIPGAPWAWAKRSFATLFGAHADGVRAIFALPLLFALLIGWEFAQHVVEVRIGFFDSPEAAKAVGNDASRMALGWVKMISVYAGGFLVIRHLAARRGTALDPIGTALIRYLPYIVYALVLFALVFYARSFVPEQHVFTFRATVSLIQLAIEPLLMLWIVSAATNGAVPNPIRSARLMGWLYFWAFLVYFLGRIPVNAAHQLLNRYAMGQPEAVLWAMLAVDAVMVGLIISVIHALYVRIAAVVMERGERA